MSATMMECGHTANATGPSGPCCAICILIDAGSSVAIAAPDLAGRIAKCGCGARRQSSLALPFFEYRGPGSREARDTCKCGYAHAAHDPAEMARNVPSNRRTVVEQGKCAGFAARGPAETDRYYCGCRGWD